MRNTVPYLDFDLLISRAEDGYRAQVLSSPAGEATADFSAPFSDLELENFVLRIGRPRRGMRRISSPEMEAVRTLGKRLYDAVFSGDVRACWRASLNEAEAQNTGLRLRLRIADAPELSDLPWEYLYNASLNRFLSLSEHTPLVRYLDLPERIRPLTIDTRLKILVMMSSPTDYPGLDVEYEWSRLNEALAGLIDGGQVQLERLAEARLGALQRALRRDEYHVLHFIGHGGFDPGTQDGVLVLCDEAGKGRRVTAEHLGTMLHDHRSLRLAVLNACEGSRSSRADPFAGVAQTLVQQGVPAVIAMQFEITDHAAIIFADEFYAATADGYPIDAALAAARKAIFATGNDIEWGTPVLYLRAPDGRLFSVNREAARLAEEEKRRAEAARQAEEEERRAEAARQAEEEKRRAEAARQAEEEKRRAEAARVREEGGLRYNFWQYNEQQARQAEEKRKAETAARESEAQHKAEAARQPEEKQRAEAAWLTEEDKRRAEAARLAEEKQRAEAAWLAEEEKRRADTAGPPANKLSWDQTVRGQIRLSVIGAALAFLALLIPPYWAGHEFSLLVIALSVSATFFAIRPERKSLAYMLAAINPLLAAFATFLLARSFTDGWPPQYVVVWALVALAFSIEGVAAFLNIRKRRSPEWEQLGERGVTSLWDQRKRPQITLSIIGVVLALISALIQQHWADAVFVEVVVMLLAGATFLAIQSELDSTAYFFAAINPLLAVFSVFLLVEYGSSWGPSLTFTIESVAAILDVRWRRQKQPKRDYRVRDATVNPTWDEETQRAEAVQPSAEMAPQPPHREQGGQK